MLLMDWIEGETMETYIAENYTDSYEMSMLCYRFCKMAAWLRSQSFAHGDIKPDNIMVRPDGTLTLVDYDGMFVPAMKGQKSPTFAPLTTSTKPLTILPWPPLPSRSKPSLLIRPCFKATEHPTVSFSLPPIISI